MVLQPAAVGRELAASTGRHSVKPIAIAIGDRWPHRSLMSLAATDMDMDMDGRVEAIADAIVRGKEGVAADAIVEAADQGDVEAVAMAIQQATENGTEGTAGGAVAKAVRKAPEEADTIADAVAEGIATTSGDDMSAIKDTVRSGKTEAIVTVLVTSGSAMGKATAVSESRNEVINASTEAIAEAVTEVDSGGNVEASASAAAEAIGSATATAVASASVSGSVDGQGAVAVAAQSNAKAIGVVVAIAIAEAFASATDNNTEAVAAARAEISGLQVARAIASAQASASTTSGTVEAFSESISEAVARVVVQAIADALVVVSNGSSSAESSSEGSTNTEDMSSVDTETGSSSTGDGEATSGATGNASVFELPEQENDGDMTVKTFEFFTSECICSDFPRPDALFTCAEQRDFGKCDEVWMRDTSSIPEGFCQVTCGLCPCKYPIPREGSPFFQIPLPDGLVLDDDGGTSGDDEASNQDTDMEVDQCICSDFIPPESSFTCAEQRDFGKCNEPWMRDTSSLSDGFCQVTCGLCSCKNPTPREGSPSFEIPLPNELVSVDKGESEEEPCQCSDTPPPGSSFTCAEQRNFGKCNAEWMRDTSQIPEGFCQITCQLCPCEIPVVNEGPSTLSSLVG